MRGMYTLLLRLALPLILLRLWWRGRREPDYRRHVDERFGRHAGRAPAELLWIHAVSVGEARAASPLVAALRASFPQYSILLTCTTAAGRATINQIYGETVLCAYLPYDYPGATRRFIEHFRPRLGILMETEVWPNLVETCAERNIPLVLANARLSEKSARGYGRFRSLAEESFGALAAVCAQSEEDAARLRALGAREVRVTGNLKFDVALDDTQLQQGREWKAATGRPTLLLASTREGEEKLLLDALPAWDGRLLVLVVPRHPQRFDEVAALADARRTRKRVPEASERIYLGDTMGEMAFYYGAGEVAIIGGSFVPVGGQNVIEAFAAGSPAVAGPSMFNFAEAARLGVEAGALLQVPDAASAISKAIELLGDPEKRGAMARAGRAVCDAHRGATERHLIAISELLKARARD